MNISKQEERRKPRYLYMAVTNDKMELPVFFADSSKELAKVVGIAASTVLTYICRNKNMERYKQKDTCNRLSKTKYRFVKVELLDDDKDLMADIPESISV